MPCESSVTIENFTLTFAGETPLSSGLIRWCWTIAFTGSSGPALSHWDIQTCPQLSLTELKRLQIADVTNPNSPVTLLDTADPAVIDSLVDFKNGFPDGFPVYGMKTDLPGSIPELGRGKIFRFCYDLDEDRVPLMPAAGLAATKSGAGQAADGIASDLCTPGCGTTPPQRRGRGIRI